MRPPTREEHDAIVAAKGRPYTSDSMRNAVRHDEGIIDTEASVVDRVLADMRRAVQS